MHRGDTKVVYSTVIQFLTAQRNIQTDSNSNSTAAIPIYSDTTVVLSISASHAHLASSAHLHLAANGSQREHSSIRGQCHSWCLGLPGCSQVTTGHTIALVELEVYGSGVRVRVRTPFEAARGGAPPRPMHRPRSKLCRLRLVGVSGSVRLDLGCGSNLQPQTGALASLSLRTAVVVPCGADRKRDGWWCRVRLHLQLGAGVTT